MKMCSWSNGFRPIMSLCMTFLAILSLSSAQSVSVVEDIIVPATTDAGPIMPFSSTPVVVTGPSSSASIATSTSMPPPSPTPTPSSTPSPPILTPTPSSPSTSLPMSTPSFSTPTPTPALQVSTPAPPVSTPPLMATDPTPTPTPPPVTTPSSTTQATNPSTNPPPTETGGFPMAAIIGIAAGGGVVLLIIVGFCLCCCAYCLCCQDSVHQEYTTGNEGFRPHIVVRTYNQNVERQGSVISRGSRGSFARSSISSIASSIRSLRRLSGKRRSKNKQGSNLVNEESVPMKVTPL